MKNTFPLPLLMVLALLLTGCDTESLDRGLATVIGMSIAYAASFLGLLLAWRSYRKHHPKEED